MAIGKELHGKRFGMLTVREFRSTSNGRIWDCDCECGGRREVTSRDLTDGKVHCCGCKNHGMSRSPEYRAWQSMKDRCHNKKYRLYKNYGGRGISVSKDWVESFSNFYADMGDKPFGDCSLDRIDVHGNYCKENCRWATREQQNRNRTDSHIYTYKGITKSLNEHGRDHGISAGCIWVRVVKLGWSIERAIETPVRKKHARRDD